MRTNKQLSKLLHSDVKNLTSILVCHKGPKSLTWNSKYCICEIITFKRPIFYTFTWESSANRHPTNWALLQWCEELNFHFELPQWWQLYFQWNIEKLYIYLKSTFNSFYTSLLKYHLLANNHFIKFSLQWGELLFSSAAKDPSFCLQKQNHNLCLCEIIN